MPPAARRGTHASAEPYPPPAQEYGVDCVRAAGIERGELLLGRAYEHSGTTPKPGWYNERARVRAVSVDDFVRFVEMHPVCEGFLTVVEHCRSGGGTGPAAAARAAAHALARQGLLVAAAVPSPASPGHAPAKAAVASGVCAPRGPRESRRAHRRARRSACGGGGGGTRGGGGHAAHAAPEPGTCVAGPRATEVLKHSVRASPGLRARRSDARRLPRARRAQFG